MVVEAFVEMIEAGRVEFRHADEADFERELAFERRVEAYARPRLRPHRRTSDPADRYLPMPDLTRRAPR